MGRKLKGKIGSKNLKSTLLGYQAKEKALRKRNQQLSHKQKPVVSSKVKKNQQKQKEQETKYIPFNKDETLLLIGDGDFSFAKSLLEQEYILAENLIVTSYDASIQELKLKYPNTFEKNYEFLVNNNVPIFFRIDCTNLIKSFKLSKKNPWKKIMLANGNSTIGGKTVQNIMFNFPHNGKGIKDMDKNIKEHQELVMKYFENCKKFFQLVNSSIVTSRNKYTQGYSLGDSNSKKKDKDTIAEDGIGKIILTVFTGEPYDLWEVRALAKQDGLQVEKSNKFQWDNYPGYHHKRTNSEQDTTKPAEEREARIYVFKKYQKVDKKSAKRDEDEDIE